MLGRGRRDALEPAHNVAYAARFLKQLRQETESWSRATAHYHSRDPDRVVKVYTADTIWRNRAEFPQGQAQVHAFLLRKWSRELEYRLIKELWSFTGDRIAVRFAYEWRDDSHHWFRSHGNEIWELDGSGLMQRREARSSTVAR